ncbi:MAG TPA: M48 family metalloprotease [Polyangiaceae bacterium]|nr:M48 family metalloprotease [Polyangiaceae bacterium]
MSRLRLRRWFSGSLIGAALVVMGSCSRERPRPAVYPTPAYGTAGPYGTNTQGYPQQGYPQQQPYPQQGYPQQQPYPQQSVPQPNPPQVAVPLPASPLDPINRVDIGFLRGRALAVLGELVANLPEPQQSRVRGIPLVTDDTVGEVNAFATCTRSGQTAMAITDGLLDIQAHLAQARAIDELFGSRKTDEYIQFIARNQRPKSPIVQPPLGMFDANQSADGRKVARQHDVLDEQLAFVLGHELAHHYLGHLPCTGASGLSGAEVARVLADAVPMFNQGFEIAADSAGINNVLTTGGRRQGYHFTEGGALLTMQFFAGIDQFSAADILFGFERTHPPPAVRTPIIQQAAALFRATGGRGLPVIGF